VLGNHDVPRIATRIGQQRAPLAQMLLLTLRGTPTVYYGDELGMTDVPIPPELVVDPQAAAGRTRDGARTPMQWDAGPNAGFAPEGAKPWLPLGADHADRNVAAELADPRSPLALVRTLLRVRRGHPALVLGSYRSLDAGHDEVFAFVREHEEERVVVALNFGATTVVAELGTAGSAGRILCATGLDRDGQVDLGRLELGPHEGLVVAASGG
jgi:alpha-glucosidase